MAGILSEIKELKGSLSAQETLAGTLSVGQHLSGLLTIPDGISIEEYDGQYEVTPTLETQTLNTEGLKMTDNVIINPIPSNYGLITWNGSVITVS